MRASGMCQDKGILLFLFLLVHSVATIGCERAPPNFILIVVDSLRSEEFADLEYDTVFQSKLAGLTRQDVTFKSAYAPASWTLPSVASILVSQEPSQHGVMLWGSKLSEESITLPEIMHEAGYLTCLWTANLLVSSDRGFGQGFNVYEFLPDYPLLLL